MSITKNEIAEARAAIAKRNGCTLGGRSCITNDDIDFAIAASGTSEPPTKATKPAIELPSGQVDPEPKPVYTLEDLMKRNGPQLKKIAESLGVTVAEGAERQAIAEAIVEAQKPKTEDSTEAIS